MVSAWQPARGGSRRTAWGRSSNAWEKLLYLSLKILHVGALLGVDAAIPHCRARLFNGDDLAHVIGQEHGEGADACVGVH